MERISGATPGGNRPRELAIWLGQEEPRLHLWVHPPDGGGGCEVRVSETELRAALDRAVAAGPVAGEGTASATLLDYFQEGRWRPALRRYAQFAEESGWSVPHRLEMYNQAKLAFDLTLEEGVRQEAFGYTYESLRAYWQVFRGAATHWSVEAAFEFFATQGEDCGAGSVRSLENVSRSEMKAVVLPFLEKLGDLKTVPDSSYPTIAVSRFLHFFNPRFFPNFDNTVINQQVLQVFGNDFDRYCADTGIDKWEHEAAFYGQYMLWAGRHIQNAEPELFADFETWFKAQVEGEEDPNGVLEEIGQCHATVFEFVAIGAAKLGLEG
jgi:hypothetical protein